MRRARHQTYALSQRLVKDTIKLKTGKSRIWLTLITFVRRQNDMHNACLHATVNVMLTIRPRAVATGAKLTLALQPDHGIGHYRMRSCWDPNEFTIVVSSS